MFMISLFFYILFSIKVSLVISSFLIACTFGLLCYLIFRMIRSRGNFKFLFFKEISGGLSVSLLTLISFVVSIYFFSVNLIISTEFGQNLTIKEKLELYTLPLQTNNTSTTDYNKMKKDKKRATHKNVTIYYQNHEKELVPIIKDVLNKADQVTTDLFGPINDNGIDLILHASTDELYEKTSLKQTIGYFDDPNDIIGVAITDLPSILSDEMPQSFYFSSTLMHEYTHYRLQAFVKEQGLYVYRIPLWFHEGVAEYVGMYNVDHRYFPFEEADFKKLVTHNDWEKFRLNDFDVYTQSYYAIQFIVNQFGESIIKTIIEETAQVNDFEKGFSTATGFTIEELQKLYVKDAKKQSLNKPANF